MLRYTLAVCLTAHVSYALAADPQVLFEDRFEGKLAEGCPQSGSVSPISWQNL